MTRSSYLDTLKGCLIICVIVGHILKGSTDENFIRYLIYSFHMPLFAGIGGYLFSKSSLLSKSFYHVVRKYFKRLFIPWITAILIYFVVNNFAHIYQIFSVHKFVLLFIKPYYHLWYIPAFLSWVILIWVFNKIKLNIWVVTIVAILITLSSIIFFYRKADFVGINDTLISSIGIKNYSYLQYFFNLFRPHFFLFFFFGFYFDKLKMKNNRILIYVFTLTLLSYMILFYFHNTILSVTLFLVMNIALLNISLNIKIDKGGKIMSGIRWIGENSLSVYLWHMLPVILLNKYFSTISLYYSLSFFVLLSFITLIIYFQQFNLLKNNEGNE